MKQQWKMLSFSNIQEFDTEVTNSVFKSHFIDFELTQEY